ncbi:MAG: ATP synthase F1 subunit delta [Peptococcaceae bacterium]|nr:ATP synthase F1 subunit delta [Peptococcaceae bacterium]
MLAGALAKRYARALFELATLPGVAGEPATAGKPDVAGSPKDSTKLLDQIDAELKEFSALLGDNRQLYTILNHPNIGLSDKKTLVSRVCEGYSRMTLSFLSLLIESRRQNLFGAIVREFGRMADESRHVVEVNLTSAGPLTDMQEKELIKALSVQTGSAIRLIRAVDADLIGGVKLRIGDTVIDGSVQTALRKMRSDLRRAVPSIESP